MFLVRKLDPSGVRFGVFPSLECGWQQAGHHGSLGRSPRPQAPPGLLTSTLSEWFYYWLFLPLRSGWGEGRTGVCWGCPQCNLPCHWPDPVTWPSLVLRAGPTAIPKSNLRTVPEPDAHASEWVPYQHAPADRQRVLRPVACASARVGCGRGSRAPGGRCKARERPFIAASEHGARAPARRGPVMDLGLARRAGGRLGVSQLADRHLRGGCCLGASGLALQLDQGPSPRCGADG